jgi:hypothetical protein
MGMENLGDLIAEIRKARADLDGIIDNRDQRYIKRFDALEGSVNEFYKKLNRPGAESTGADTDERKDAVDCCILKHAIAHPKADTAEVKLFADIRRGQGCRGCAGGDRGPLASRQCRSAG